MKKIKIEIKKELTEEEYQDVVKGCKSQLKEGWDIKRIANACEENTKKITPATVAYLLLADTEKNIFSIETLQETLTIAIEEESILTECIKTKQPLLVNDVTHSFLYKESIDNFLNLEIKDLLLIPIVHDSTENILAIIWAAIEKGSWNQYTPKDLDYMTRYSFYIKQYLQGELFHDTSFETNTELQSCLKEYDKLSALMRREQEYFSSIIHDVRTPMNAVMGFLELLSLQEKDTQKKEYINTALNSGKSMIALINDALDISKLASGKMDVEKVSFSPLEELKDVAKLFFNTAKKKNIQFHVFYDPSLPSKVVSDYHRIKQIINNLLSNAVKFTPENGSIFLSLIYESEKDGLRISVKDTGIGIAKEKQDDIFTPYKQEKSSTSREYGGTGLGLSISQQLSILLGGKLQLKSEEGKGSEFYFTVPCHTPDGTVPSFDTSTFMKYSFVVYDTPDDQSNITIIQKYLDYLGAETDFIDNMKEVLTSKNKTFDILIVFHSHAIEKDTEVQKVLDEGKSVLIFGDTFLNEECRFSGNVERLNMPFLPQEIVQAVQKIMGKEEKQKEADTIKDLAAFEDKHILVIDDNSINLKFMKEVLKTLNLEALLAQNGEDGIKIFNEEKIDLIFVDENMPGMQGDEVIELIRKKEKDNTERIPIIGLTGNADKKTEDLLLQSGANKVLTKPVQLHEIISVVTDYIVNS